jgi:hypothetical protein
MFSRPSSLIFSTREEGLEEITPSIGANDESIEKPLNGYPSIEYLQWVQMRKKNPQWVQILEIPTSPPTFASTDHECTPIEVPLNV